jgi:hypothetical protein
VTDVLGGYRRSEYLPHFLCFEACVCFVLLSSFSLPCIWV